MADKIKVDFFGLRELQLKVNSFIIKFADKRKMTDGALKAFFIIEEQMFATLGGMEPWQQLSPKYAQEKDRLGFGNMPLMQMTGKLKNALTGKDKTSLIINKKSDIDFDIFILSEYWHNHQFGSTIPQRKTVNMSDANIEFIIDSMLRASIGGRLARFFTKR